PGPLPTLPRPLARLLRASTFPLLGLTRGLLGPAVQIHRFREGGNGGRERLPVERALPLGQLRFRRVPQLARIPRSAGRPDALSTLGHLLTPPLGGFPFSELRLARRFLEAAIPPDRRPEGGSSLPVGFPRERGVRLGGPGLGLVPESGGVPGRGLRLRGPPRLRHLLARL